MKRQSAKVDLEDPRLDLKGFHFNAGSGYALQFADDAVLENRVKPLGSQEDDRRKIDNDQPSRDHPKEANQPRNLKMPSQLHVFYSPPPSAETQIFPCAPGYGVLRLRDEYMRLASECCFCRMITRDQRLLISIVKYSLQSGKLRVSLLNCREAEEIHREARDKQGGLIRNISSLRLVNQVGSFL